MRTCPRPLWLAGVLLLSTWLPAQQPAMELRIFDALSVYRGSSPAVGPMDLPLRTAFGSPYDGEDEFDVDPDLLVDLMRDNVFPESWDQEGASLQSAGNHIVVVNEAAVVEEAARFLDYLRAAIGRRYAVEVYRLDRAALGAKGGVRTAEETGALLDRAKPSLLGRLSGRDGSASRLRAGDDITFVADYDVEVAQKSSAYDPVVRVVKDGIDLRVRVRTTPSGTAAVKAEVMSSSLASLTTVEVAGGASIRSPRVSTVLGVGSAVVPLGGSFVIGADDGASGGFFLLKITADPAPTSPPDRFALLSTGALTVPPLMAPGDEDEPEALMEVEHVVELVMSRIDEWDAHEGNRIAARGGAVFVRSSPENVAKMRRILTSLHDRMARTVELEVRAGWIEPAAARTVASGAADLGATARTLSTLAVGSAIPGDRFRLTLGDERTVVRDYDVEIAEDSHAYNPVVSTVFDGLELSGRATLIGQDRVGLELQVSFESTEEAPRFPIPEAGDPTIETPRAHETRHEAREILERGRWRTLFMSSSAAREGSFVILVRAR